MKALLLLSSGIDSPVAGSMAIEKGLHVEGFFFRQNKESYEKVKDIAKALGLKRLYVADQRLFMEHIFKKNTEKFTCILCKRFMYRICSRFAKKNKFSFLVDGSNLGQVASQTLENIVLSSEASEIEVLRPLLGLEKKDIIMEARKNGTFEISAEKEPVCAYVPRYPVTRTNKGILLNEEKKLNIKKIVESTLSSVKEITF